MCLLACGALADEALDSASPLRSYDDVLGRALKLLQLDGIESQLTVLLLKVLSAPCEATLCPAPKA